MRRRWSRGMLSCCVIMTLLVTLLFPVTLSADELSDRQIVDPGGIKYYDKAGREVTNSPVLGSNSVVSINKTVSGTAVENEFVVDLEVKTSLDISNVNTSPDAAVVLVLDISGSMEDHVDGLKSAAYAFLDSFADVKGDAARYVSLVAFADEGLIKSDWVDITQGTNRQDMKTDIRGLTAYGGTFMQGGLLMARNLLRTEALPTGSNGAEINNLSVILFSDGQPTFSNSLTRTTPEAERDTASYVESNRTLSTKIQYGTTNESRDGLINDDGNGRPDQVSNGNQNRRNSIISLIQTRTANMAAVIKDNTTFAVSGSNYTKEKATLYTIGYGSASPNSWLSTTIASPGCAYTAGNAAALNDVFKAISQRIESWAKAWTVTDPMGENIQFGQATLPVDSRLYSYDEATKTLTWNLKDSPAQSENNGTVFTYQCSYTMTLDNTGSTFAAKTPTPTNGNTTLDYVMVEDGEITGGSLTAAFKVPTVEGYLGKLQFTKVGSSDTPLDGCVFKLTEATNEDMVYTATSDVNGTVVFENIPSGNFSYTLTEDSLPDQWKDLYILSDDSLEVVVSMGEVTIDGAPVSQDYQFVNELMSVNFSFIKIDGNIYAQDGKTTKELAGAEFSVYQCSDQNKGELVPADVVFNGQTSAEWTLIAEGVTSDKDGVVSLSLPNGSYMLVETKAPFIKSFLFTEEVQYQLPYGQWSLTVDKTQSPQVAIVAVADTNGQLPPAFVQPTDTNDSYKLQNMRVHDLPLTGGPGIGLFVGIGTALLLTGALLLFVMIRRSRPAKATALKQ